jgi:hypothetical protein
VLRWEAPPSDLEEVLAGGEEYVLADVPPQPDHHDPVRQVKEMVYGLTGITPTFSRRPKGTHSGRQVIVDVVIGSNGSTRRLGTGQGDNQTSASRSAAQLLLKDGAQKLRRTLESVRVG